MSHSFHAENFASSGAVQPEFTSKMRNKFILASLIVFVSVQALAQDRPALSEIDRIRLAEAFTIGESLGNLVWRDWNKAPFAVLLVTPEQEFLIRHPNPTKAFTLLGYDRFLKSNVYFRKRTFAPNLLATFPAVAGISTIVVGQAENTDSKTSTPWVVTLLHEHFHQLQDSQPNAFQEVEALNLSRGDTSGMWMLNFAFPYETAEVKEQINSLSRLLAEVLQTKKKQEFSVKAAAYMAARRRLQQILSPDDYRYFSFQLWKEGIARFTEYRIARLAAEKHSPSKAFRGLKDYKSFKEVADGLQSKILQELTTLELDQYKRVAFYPIGAGEGLLLDRLNPRWQSRYFSEKFYLEKYFNNSE